MEYEQQQQRRERQYGAEDINADDGDIIDCAQSTPRMAAEERCSSSSKKRSHPQSSSKSNSRQVKNTKSKPTQQSQQQRQSTSSSSSSSSRRDENDARTMFNSVLAECKKCTNDEEVDMDEEDEAEQQVNSVYVEKPIRGIFCEIETLNKFLSEMVESFNEMKPDYFPILCNSDDVRDLTVKMNKNPVKRQHFTQFNYKTPIRLAVVTNMYGAFVNNQDHFNERAKIFDLLSLEPSHKVSMLLPSAKYWWDSKSRKLMTSFILDKFVNDLKILSATDEFCEAVHKFGIKDPVRNWEVVKEKLLSGTKTGNDGLIAPTVFNVKVNNTMTSPSKINVPITTFGADGVSCKTTNWNKLILNPVYIHAAAVISVSGFKVTRSGISLDMAMDVLSYMQIPDELLHRKISTVDTDAKFLHAKCKNNKFFKFDLGAEDSDSDYNDNISSREKSSDNESAKKRCPMNFT